MVILGKGKAMPRALIVIDMQADFCPGGALAVADGDGIVGPINALMADHDAVVLTQDWHPANHASFAANHAGAEPFSVAQMPYGPQVLWPAHCVIGTKGADFHPDLDLSRVDLVIRKGFRPQIDSYSAFFENDHQTPTGLAGYLRDRGLLDLTFVGLAHDFCVAWSAMDAARGGFAATVIESATRAIDLNGSLDRARTDMRAAGVTLE
jgi:nicotinamidase/pyrazinamidase